MRLRASAKVRTNRGGSLYFFSRIHDEGHPVQVERGPEQRRGQQRGLPASVQGPRSSSTCHGD